MKKVISLPLVVALAATVSACDMTGNDQVASQRDVYKTLEDCVADWGDSELCEKQMADAKAEAEKKAAQSNSNGGSHVAIIPLFFGPSYSPGDRYVYRNGERYIPTTSKASSTAAYFRNTKTGVVSKPSFASPSKPTFSSFSKPSGVVSRGGFGSVGRGVSVSS